MGGRAELLAIVEKQDLEAVVQYVKTAQSQKKDVSETLSECSGRQLQDMWESLFSACSGVLMEEEGEDREEENTKKKSQQAFLDAVVSLAWASVQLKNTIVPPGLMDTAALLHGVLLTLPESLEGVKLRLAQLFEWCGRQALPGAEHLLPNTLFYFLRRSLALQKVQDVKSVWKLHAVLPLIQLGSGSGAELMNQLGLCAASPVYLKQDEGRRFLSYVMTVNSTLVDCMHRALKNHIPYAPKSWLPFYGEIYFRAWQKSSGDIQQKLENDCIQDLMNHAIHASRHGAQSMAATLFKVLHYLHSQKKQRDVDAMLLRLYNPILWRSLTVPNGDVRANAAHLLLDVFPLQDPADTAQDTDTLVQKQFDFMQRLLADPFPVVRALTVEGVCSLLSHYLEMIPGEVVQALLCKLLKDLAWDTTSTAVRLAVVKGVSGMLDSALCHLLLKPLLPSLSLCLHDKAESVRTAMVDLLLKVKGIRSFKYWSICPVEHLLSRLESDSQPVVRRLVDLLFPSFLPLDLGWQEQISRCATLIQSNPQAARVFFLNAPRHLSLTDTVKYMTLLCRYVLENVRAIRAQQENSQLQRPASSDARSKRSKATPSQARSEDKSDEASDEENEEEEEEEALAPEMLQGLLEAIFLLWSAVTKQLDAADNAELKQSVMKKLSVMVPEVMKVTDDPRMLSLLVEMAGHLPPKTVPVISGSCLSKLRHMAELSTEDDYREILEAMCMWQMAPQVLELLSDWLEDTLTTPTQPDQPAVAAKEKAPGQGGKKRVQISVPEERPRPALAVDYLRVMLTSAVCKRVLTDSHRPLLVRLNKLLSRVMAVIEARVSREEESESEKELELLGTIFCLHLRLSVLLHNVDEESEDSVERMKKMLIWGQEKLLPCLVMERGEGTEAQAAESSQAGKLATLCVTTVLTVCSNMLMLGIGTQCLMNHILSFSQALLQHGSSLALLDQVLACLYQLLLFEDLNAGPPVTQCLARLMPALNACLHSHRETNPKTLTSVRSKLQGVISCVTSGYQSKANDQDTERGLAHQLTATLLTACVAELAQASRQDKLPSGTEDSQEATPFVCGCVIAAFSRTLHSRRLFVQEMEAGVRSGSISDIHDTHATVHLLMTLQQKEAFSRNMDWGPVRNSVQELVEGMSNPSEDQDVDEFRDVMSTVQSKLKVVLDQAS